MYQKLGKFSVAFGGLANSCLSSKKYKNKIIGDD